MKVRSRVSFMYAEKKNALESAVSETKTSRGGKLEANAYILSKTLLGRHLNQTVLSFPAGLSLFRILLMLITAVIFVFLDSIYYNIFTHHEFEQEVAKARWIAGSQHMSKDDDMPSQRAFQ